MPATTAKPPKGNRRDFIRTEVPTTERISSIIIVLLIVAAGVAIWIKGKHFDPGRYALRPEALSGTATEVEGKAGTLRATGDGRPVGTITVAGGSSTTTAGYEEGYESAMAPAVGSVAKREPLEVRIAGLEAMSPTEFYNVETLYEKINGRAPAYFSFNFQSLRSRSFAVTGGGDSFVDVYEYFFDTPVNAFGMLALERDPNGTAIDFAPDGYASELGYFFRQGACYAQILASDQKPQTLALAKALAQARAAALPADDAGLEARRRLPNKGLIDGSVQFVGENALGQEFLKDVFQAQFDLAGSKLSFFVMVAAPEQAAAAWEAFREFSGKFGSTATALPEVNGAKIFQAEHFGLWKVVFQRDGEVGGVFDAQDASAAREFVEQYLRSELK